MKPEEYAAEFMQWVRDTFHGSAIGRELSDTSHNQVLEAAERFIARIRAHKAADEAPAPDA